MVQMLMVDFGTSKTNDIYTNSLDSFNIKNVKLFKIDAEVMSQVPKLFRYI